MTAERVGYVCLLIGVMLLGTAMFLVFEQLFNPVYLGARVTPEGYVEFVGSDLSASFGSL